jgi:hypothetical protein
MVNNKVDVFGCYIENNNTRVFVKKPPVIKFRAFRKIYFQATVKNPSLFSAPHKFAQSSFSFTSRSDSESIKLWGSRVPRVRRFQTANQYVPAIQSLLITSEADLQAGACNYSRINNFKLPKFQLLSLQSKLSP